MEKQDHGQAMHRRKFLGTFATGAASLGIASLASPLGAKADMNLPLPGDVSEADSWFNKVKGKHKIVYDCPHPHEIFPFAWPKVFLLTNAATGTAAKDCGVVVILRHSAICYAMGTELWEKYNFGQVFKADDPKTKEPSKRNPFWKPAAGDFVIPGFGEVKIGINELQEDGVMFCVCDAAMTVYSAAVAAGMKKDAAEVKKEWMAGLLPGIQPVPSGVWAVGRAQEHGCAYCFAG